MCVSEYSKNFSVLAIVASVMGLPLHNCDIMVVEKYCLVGTLAVNK